MKIICIGRNYVAHALELKNEVPDEPVFFMKPETALLKNNDPFPSPLWSSEVHHEIELVIKISKQAKNIDKKLSDQYFDEIGLGIDFTARDIQNQLRSKGLPWEKSKAFDFSAAIGNEFISKNRLSDSGSIQYRLEKNGKTVQRGNSSLMIFNFGEIISYVSNYVTLNPGDLIFTGTPAGVGPVKSGDRLCGYLENQIMFDFMIK